MEKIKTQSEAELRTEPSLLICRCELVILYQFYCLVLVLWGKKHTFEAPACNAQAACSDINSFFLTEIAHLKTLITLYSLLREFLLSVLPE